MDSTGRRGGRRGPIAGAVDPEALGWRPNRTGPLSCFEQRRQDPLGHSRTHWVLGEDRPGGCKGSRGDLGAHGHGPESGAHGRPSVPGAVSPDVSAAEPAGSAEGPRGQGSVRGKSRRPGFDVSTGDDGVVAGGGGRRGDAPRRADAGLALTALTSNGSGSRTKWKSLRKSSRSSLRSKKTSCG